MESAFGVAKPNATANPSATGPSPPAAVAPLGAKQRRIISCISCQQRKVKCDRQDPCAPCVKSRLQCQYRAPVTARKRRKKVPADASLHERLAKLEDILKTVAPDASVSVAGAKKEGSASSTPSPAAGEGRKDSTSTGTAGILSPPASEHSEPQAAQAENIFESLRDMGPKAAKNVPSSEFGTGRMFTDQGKSLYTENKLWVIVSDQLRDMREMLEASSSEDEDTAEDYFQEPTTRPSPEDFVLNPRASKADLATYHPPPAQILQLWQLFLDGINPLTKIIHVPTLQPTVLTATTNPDQLSKADHALLFSIYACGALTLAEEECMALFGETVANLQDRYQFAARQTFVHVGLFRTTDLRVLQAFVLFLTSIRLSLNARSFWTLCGVATRIAQRMGVHRDGAAYSLPPFEAEMRRRLWWQLNLLDFSAAELCGSELAPIVSTGDARPPLAIDDADITPDCLELPPERTEGPSEMMYPSIRYIFTSHFRDNVAKFAKTAGISWNLTPTDPRLPAVASRVQALRARVRQIIEEKHLRHATHAVPVQHFCLTRFRMAFAAFNLRGGQQAPLFFFASLRGLERPQRDELFAMTRKVVADENAAFRDPALARFRWHMRGHVQWHPFLGLLMELRERAGEEGQGAALAQAWRDVDEALHHHPEVTERRDPLYAAICSLALKAWEAMEREYPGGAGPDGAPLVVPSSLAAFRQRRASKGADAGGSSSAPNSDKSPESMGLPSLQSAMDFGMGPGAAPGLDFSLFDDEIMTASSAGGSGGDPGAWDPWTDLVQNYGAQGLGGSHGAGMAGIGLDPATMGLDPTKLQTDLFDAPMSGSR